MSEGLHFDADYAHSHNCWENKTMSASVVIFGTLWANPLSFVLYIYLLNREIKAWEQFTINILFSFKGLGLF